MNVITDQIPELSVSEEAFRVNNAVFDAEIVCLDEQGRADFKKVIRRLMSKKNFDALSRRNPAYCYLFDCLYMDGKQLTQEPLLRRREWLKGSIKKDSNYRISEIVEDGEALFEAAKQLGVEGIMSKEPLGKYYPDRRSDTWVKVKVKSTRDFVIIGYTPGEGERAPYFGSLQIAEKKDDQLIYRGRVGSGFDDNLLKHL